MHADVGRRIGYHLRGVLQPDHGDEVDAAFPVLLALLFVAELHNFADVFAAGLLFLRPAAAVFICLPLNGELESAFVILPSDTRGRGRHLGCWDLAAAST